MIRTGHLSTLCYHKLLADAWLNSLPWHGQMDTEAPFASAFAALAASSGGGAWRTLYLQTSARFVSFGAFTGDCRPIPTMSCANLMFCCTM